MYIDLLDLAPDGLCSPFLEWLRAQPWSQSSLVQIPTVPPTSFEIGPLCVLLCQMEIITPPASWGCYED